MDGRHAGLLHLTTRLVGGFNVSNVLAAAGAALALGLPAAAIQSRHRRARRASRAGWSGSTAGRISPPSSTLRTRPTPSPPRLDTGRELAAPDARVIAVFGSAGLRDREKRRMMGEVAAEQADYTVITAEDPRTEDLDEILAETADAMLRRGRVEGRDFERVPDRQQAILAGGAQRCGRATSSWCAARATSSPCASAWSSIPGATRTRWPGRWTGCSAGNDEPAPVRPADVAGRSGRRMRTEPCEPSRVF